MSTLLNHIGFANPAKMTEIQGGADSSVWKIETVDGIYAVRILPVTRLAQFLHEQAVIELAVSQGIPIPVVRGVTSFHDFAVMWMEWAEGETLLHALTAGLHGAYELGIEFGRIQAAIHQVQVPHDFSVEQPNWITPMTRDEADILERIDAETICETPVLLHMDYHPLNVLVKDGRVTAVLDFANACIGDARFDVARTLSILELEVERVGPEYGLNPLAIKEFQSGWFIGYQQAGGLTDSLNLFKAWAGLRMIRDLGERCSEQDAQRIRAWVAAQYSEGLEA